MPIKNRNAARLCCGQRRFLREPQRGVVATASRGLRGRERGGARAPGILACPACLSCLPIPLDCPPAAAVQRRNQSFAIAKEREARYNDDGRNTDAFVEGMQWRNRSILPQLITCRFSSPNLGKPTISSTGSWSFCWSPC